MGIGILIIGETGSGESSSLRNLTSDKIGIINVFGKPLPFRNTFKTIATDNPQKIITIMQKCKSNIIIVDDFQYLLVSPFMKRAYEKGFSKFAEIAKDYYDVIRYVGNLPAEKRVYFLSHIETTESGKEKVKTIGKLLDEKITVEGLFTIVLKTVVKDKGYYFSTQNSGNDTVKSPMGMFSAELINNDIAIVDKTICEYYNIGE